MVKVNYQASNILAAKNLELPFRIGLKNCLYRELSPEDRISHLPEEIIVAILSFLPLKEAAQTCVLSIRWMTLWMHTLRLDFDATSTLRRISQDRKILKQERRKYVAWVNRVLYSHRSSTLDEFRVCFDLNNHSQNEIDKWVEYAFVKSVKRLELNLSINGEYPRHPSVSCAFPDRLLDLCYGIHHNAFFDFKSLKELSLSSVDVTSEAIQSLLFRCPLLERLAVLGSGKLVNLVVSGPHMMLKYLEIKYCLNVEAITICNSNLVSLRISKVGKLIITESPRLAEVQICWISPHFPLYVFSQLQSCLFQLEVLMLRTYEAEGIAKLKGVPELSKLKQLVISVLQADETLIYLTSFLNFCPNLQKFVLHLHIAQLQLVQPKEVERQIEKATTCSLKSLKVIELSGYFCSTGEVELVMFFIENAVTLEKVIVDPGKQNLSLEEEHAARVRAKKQLGSLVPKNIELVIL